MEAAKAVGAHDFIARLKKGLTNLHERGQNISVGQRQLMSFARAVIADPRILVLDEATANVDTQTEVVIQQALRRMLRTWTSFVIAHRLSTIRDADRVIALDRGESPNRERTRNCSPWMESTPSSTRWRIRRKWTRKTFNGARSEAMSYSGPATAT